MLAIVGSGPRWELFGVTTFGAGWAAAGPTVSMATITAATAKTAATADLASRRIDYLPPQGTSAGFGGMCRPGIAEAAKTIRKPQERFVTARRRPRPITAY